MDLKIEKIKELKFLKGMGKNKTFIVLGIVLVAIIAIWFRKRREEVVVAPEIRLTPRLTPIPTPTPTPIPTPAPKFTPPAPTPAPGIKHIVRPGETLYGKARRYLGAGHRWEEIKGWAGRPEHLPIGTVLTIPTPTPAPARIAPPIPDRQQKLAEIQRGIDQARARVEEITRGVEALRLRREAEARDRAARDRAKPIPTPTPTPIRLTPIPTPWLTPIRLTPIRLTPIPTPTPTPIRLTPIPTPTPILGLSPTPILRISQRVRDEIRAAKGIVREGVEALKRRRKHGR